MVTYVKPGKLLDIWCMMVIYVATRLRYVTFANQTRDHGLRHGRGICGPSHRSDRKLAVVRVSFGECRPRVVDCRSRVGECRPRVAECHPWVAECHLPVRGCRSSIRSNSFNHPNSSTHQSPYTCSIPCFTERPLLS